MMRKIYITLVIALISINVFGQAPNWEWAKGAGGINLDRGCCTATDGSGNLYVAGWFESSSISFGSIVLINAGAAGTRDVFIVKYNSSGSVLWAKRVGGINNDEARAISIDGSGNAYLTGDFYSASINFGSTTITNAGATTTCDIFVLKYDSSGNEQWALRAGDVDSDFSLGIKTDVSGNFYITGNINTSSPIFGTVSLVNGGFFVVKYDSGGNVIWAKCNGGSTNISTGNSISVDGSGNIYVTGIFFNSSVTFGSYTVINSGIVASDVFVVKYNNSGNVLWAKGGGGSEYEEGLGIAADVSGNAYVTGYFNSSSIVLGSTTLFNSRPYPNQSFFVAKYNSSGNVLWAKTTVQLGTALGGGNESGRAITTDVSGNIYVIGDFHDSTVIFGMDTLVNNGTYDMFLTKYDSNGNLNWAKSVGNSGGEFGYGVATDSNRNVYVTGAFGSSSISFGSHSITNDLINYWDIYIAKLNCSSNFSQNVNLCVGQSVTIGTSSYNTAGVYMDYFSTPTNCDSIVTSRIFLLPDTVTINPVVCDSLELNSQSYTTNGTYFQTLANIVGCDSTVVINLIIHGNTTFNFLSSTNCDSITVGLQTYYTSGTYIQTLTNSQGCDSILTINLTINNVNTSVNQTGITLTAIAAPAVYQWLNCSSSYSGITSENNQSFVPSVNGDYAVMITQSGCVDTSLCVSITNLYVKENATNNQQITISPNPFSSTTTISFTEEQKNTTIKVYDVLGQCIKQLTTNNKQQTLDMSDVAKGIYFVEIKTEKGVVMKKIIKK